MATKVSDHFGENGQWDVSLPSIFLSIINGTPKGFFPATRGLGQGDPLSRFLFTLVAVADSFSQLLPKGEKGRFFRF